MCKVLRSRLKRKDIKFALQFLLFVAIKSSSSLSSPNEENTLPSAITVSSNNIKISAGQYGDPCSNFRPCNVELRLQCINSTCSCLSDNYLPKRTNSHSINYICVSQAGETCSPRTLWGTRSLSSFLWSRIRNNASPYHKQTNLPEETSCVENATCQSNICVCNEGFYNSQGECQPKKSSFQTCRSNEECASSLVCNRHRCTCAQGLITYTRAAQTNSFISSPSLLIDSNLKCYIPVGAQCDDFSSDDHECTPNSRCLNGVCTCTYGFRAEPDGTCGVDYGFSCAMYKCASSQLVCRNLRCDCKYPSHQYYDENKKQCVSKSRGPCDEFRCTENAICRKDEVHICQCENDYAENVDGKCVKTFGAICTKDIECDPIARLSCVNGQCRCPDGFQKYEPMARKCVGLVGSRCRVEFHEEDYEKGIPSLCVDGALCKMKIPMLDGICECKDGFRVDKTGLCVPGQE